MKHQPTLWELGAGATGLTVTYTSDEMVIIAPSTDDTGVAQSPQRDSA